jgi:hypothetical protein
MILYGGLKGDKQNEDTYIFDIPSSSWDIIKSSVILNN